MSKEELLNDEEFIQKLAAKVAPIVAEQIAEQVKAILNEQMNNKKTKDEDDDPIIDDKLIKVMKTLDELETKRLIRRAIYRRLTKLF